MKLLSIEPLSIRLWFTALLFIGLAGCSMPKEIEQNKQTTRQVLDTPNLIKTHIVSAGQGNESYQLRYVSSDDSAKSRPTVVFVHGTPGGWNSFARYFLDDDLRRQFRLVSLDRPGWGQSGYPGTEFPTNLEQQASLIGPALQQIWQQNNHQKFILVGHSLGGSLAPILASFYPEYVRGVVILAGDISPKLAEYRWYNSLLSWLPHAWVPDHWYYSNMEVLQLSTSLAQVQSRLARLSVPITILQGTKDELVIPENANYAKSLFKQSQLEIEWIPEAGHLIHLQHPDLVDAAIREMAGRS
ncbi:alpha/beta fold hydrolase [Vibrio mangrovi]|uniref:2-succinyl-6-hydroxy-2, 4-cyclohexadiene-1-carboxylate synthase n=1 Tax=Vibrio mangrovi TaxID=474394 RepID=A0A1Y6ITP0_9VIBR|nr:alpha/beta hydrolase [Vibrio mangrovi]MDW6004758.1 alpha/beta hydrolase [Vibrio mangrovi]SMS01049.1 2-succinyl-6-hydroxy-2, 4-cyclohexadiene-1-carboxylate synthase [Vibrio mangrovi]